MDDFSVGLSKLFTPLRLILILYTNTHASAFYDLVSFHFLVQVLRKGRDNIVKVKNTKRK